MKKLLIASILSAIASSSFAFDSNSTNEQLIKEREEATRIIQIKEEMLRLEQELKERRDAFKDKWYDGNKKIIIDGERIFVRDIPAMIDEALENRDGPLFHTSIEIQGTWTAGSDVARIYFDVPNALNGWIKFDFRLTETGWEEVPYWRRGGDLEDYGYDPNLIAAEMVNIANDEEIATHHEFSAYFGDNTTVEW